MEAWDKDGEEGRADEEQDTGREKDDMTGDGKVGWHRNGEVEKEEGSEACIFCMTLGSLECQLRTTSCKVNIKPKVFQLRTNHIDAM